MHVQYQSIKSIYEHIIQISIYRKSVETIFSQRVNVAKSNKKRQQQLWWAEVQSWLTDMAGGSMKYLRCVANVNGLACLH